eukprot:911580-Pyramimonas_sp.AAC.1
MLNGVVPEGVGSAAGVEIGASQFHNRAYGALGDAVEGVHMGRRRSGMYRGRGEDVGEFARKKLACSRKGGDEATYASRGLRAVFQEVDRFEARVIVDKHEHILVRAGKG